MSPDAPVALMEVTSGLMLARTGGMTIDVTQASVTTPRQVETLDLDMSQWSMLPLHISLRNSA